MKIVELTNTQSRLETHAINNIHSYEVVKRRWRRRNKVMWNNDLTSAYVVIYHQIHSVISLAIKSIKKLIWNDIIVCGSFVPCAMVCWVYLSAFQELAMKWQKMRETAQKKPRRILLLIFLRNVFHMRNCVYSGASGLKAPATK